MSRTAHLSPEVERLAADAARKQVRSRRTIDPDAPRSRRGWVMLGGEPIGDVEAACEVLGLAENTVRISIARGYVAVMVKVPIGWERPIMEYPKDNPAEGATPERWRGGLKRKPVWTDVPGEHWRDMAAASRAIGCARSAISYAVDRGPRRAAGRLWFSAPPAWAKTAGRDGERTRVESIRCHPGRFGSVHNGTDTRTGTVYVGGKAVAAKAPAAA